MNRVVNLGLMAHPLNWLTLFIWVFIIGFIIHMFDPYLKKAYPSTTNQ